MPSSLKDVITKYVATDRKTSQYVFVARDVYSVNGCEPQPVPADMREMDARATAKALLRQVISKDKEK